MMKTFCDGCGVELANLPGREYIAIRGHRADGMLGGLLPDGEFHLCRDCGKAAWATVRNRPPHPTVGTQ